MASHNIVAIYPSRTTAERARDHLIDHGFSSASIRLSSDTSSMSQRTDSQLDSEESNEGFFSWLFGTGISDEDRSTYRTGLTGERTAVSVLTDDENYSRVEDLLDQFSPIDLHEGAMASTSMAADTSYTHAPGAIAPTAVPPVGGGGRAAARTDGSAARSDDGEKIIPVVEEQLQVGKRATERRYRIRTHVVETPVEEQVHLRDERVVIERRPATGTTASPHIPEGRDREFEVIERHEEPVVGKQAKAVEEVVVKKEQTDRVETVRDTVRRTEVEVDEGARQARHDDDDRVHETVEVTEERIPPGAAGTTDSGRPLPR